MGRRIPADAVVLGVGAAVALLFVAAELTIAGAVGLPLDDGWIHLRFARNLAAGRGFAINPGQPVAGSTAPLWTVLLAGAMVLGVPGLVATKALGLACYAATGLVTRRLALAVGLAPGLALVAGVGAVGLGRLGWGALSGMEVPLAALLVAGGALLAARDRPYWAAATLGLATLARPEAGLLVPLHALAAGRLRAAVLRAALSGLMVVPAVAFSWATVGRLVPATAAAKVPAGLIGVLEGGGDSWSGAAARVGQFLQGWAALLWSDHWALPVLLVVGGVALRRSPLGPLPWVLLLHPIAVALVAPYADPSFQTGRYSSHLLPLALVVGVAGLGAMLTRLRSRPLRAGVVAAAALLLATGLWPASQAYGRAVENINGMQVRLGQWVARHTPPGARLALNDVGAIPYFSDRPVIDLMGLVTPDILPYRRRGPAGVLHYLFRVCPDYLVIFPAWFPDLAGRPELFRPVMTVELAHNLVAGAPVMVVYETAWNRWGAAPVPCPGDSH